MKNNQLNNLDMTFQCHTRSNFERKTERPLYDLLYAFHTNFNHTMYGLSDNRKMLKVL